MSVRTLAYHESVFKRYCSSQHFFQSFTYRMAAKTSWHRHGAKKICVTLCIYLFQRKPIFVGVSSFRHTTAVVPATDNNIGTHTHTRLTALFPGRVSGSDISWGICKSAPRSRQITTPIPHHSVFYRPDALPAAQPTASKH